MLLRYVMLGCSAVRIISITCTDYICWFNRWAMFGFAVGMLTEYATGSDFVDQVKILLSNFGILDLE